MAFNSMSLSFMKASKDQTVKHGLLSDTTTRRFPNRRMICSSKKLLVSEAVEARLEQTIGKLVKGFTQKGWCLLPRCVIDNGPAKPIENMSKREVERVSVWSSTFDFASFFEGLYTSWHNLVLPYTLKTIRSDPQALFEQSYDCMAKFYRDKSWECLFFDLGEGPISNLFQLLKISCHPRPQIALQYIRPSDIPLNIGDELKTQR